jgi:hypothetical protein
MTRALKLVEPEAEYFDPDLRAPFPWFGGKRKAAAVAWEAIGDVKNYVEPFFGSGAVLLGRPHAPRVETVNDLDAWIANFWRATTYDADEVAKHCDWPVNEADLSARHIWLVKRRQAIAERVTADPDYFDSKVAGWWVWGVCQWIGSGWCDGRGPWNTDDTGTKWVKQPLTGERGRGVKHVKPVLTRLCGVHARGVSRQLPELGNYGRGAIRQMEVETLHGWFAALRARLRRVRVTCGDWSRVLCKTSTTNHGTTGVFLDPPYDQHDGTEALYNEKNIAGLSQRVADWAIEHGNDERFRIVLCGYDGTFDPPPGWRVAPWWNGSNVGRGSAKALKGRHKERMWLSPHCFVV